MSETDPRRRRRKRLLAVALAVLAALAVLEIAVRVRIGAPLAERLPILEIQANRARGWEMLPSIEHYTYQHRVRVNALGLRGPEVGAKEEGELRVLVLGDSLVYGQGVADDETIPSHLRECLAERDSGSRLCTVVNAGHRAYDTNQELALLEELGARIDPDVVVLCWFWNDFVERPVQETFETLSKSGPVTFDTGDRVEGADWWRWQAKQLARRSALVMLVHDWVRAARSEFLSAQTIEGGTRKLGAYCKRFAADCTRLGARPVFAIVPDANTILASHPSAEIAERAAEIARASGLTVVTLLEPLRALATESGELPVLAFDGHYSDAGNRAMAERLATGVLEYAPASR